ncbi:uncharacterized protein LOC128962797 [Oppia nitens]|uniref:uncharacterized protein LOC128962797 n=1 Tax=Oppia nitens TaxID=1686743 RepID=UPI0023DA5933|nr:uncharacterized protein LOC128962797 [Oppia nitens]
MTTMNAICLIALLLLVSIIAPVVQVVVEPKDFCKEYHRNGQKIDFAYRMIEFEGKFFFIGNTYWKLQFIDGPDDNKTVTINNESDGESNFITGDNYSMVWCNWYLKDAKPTIHGVNYDHCRVGGLKKNLKTIDWAVVSNVSLRLMQTSDSTNIKFEDNFKPLFAWLPESYRKQERVTTFWSNNHTIVYNFYDPNNPLKGIPSIVREDTQRCNINGTYERKLNIELMTIVSQYSEYDNNGVQKSINGHGSIVFTNENQIIRYCYVGQPFNETACKPSNMKTLIDCSLDTKPSSSLTMIMIILVVVIVVLVLFIVGLIILVRKFVGQGGDEEVPKDGSSVSAISNVQNSKLMSTRSAMPKPTKGKKTISPSKTGGSTNPTKSPTKAKTPKAK